MKFRPFTNDDWGMERFFNPEEGIPVDYSGEPPEQFWRSKYEDAEKLITEYVKTAKAHMVTCDDISCKDCLIAKGLDPNNYSGICPHDEELATAEEALFKFYKEVV